MSDDSTTVDTSAPADPEVEAPKAKRGDRTNLEGDLMTVLNKFITGEDNFDGKQPTPHVLAKAIHELRGKQGNAPSGGAVAAALDRWAEVGYIELSPKPKAFIDYTDEGRNLGLAALKAAHRQRLASARAATKAQATPAAAPAEPVVEPVQAEEPVVELVATDDGATVQAYAPF